MIEIFDTFNEIFFLNRRAFILICMWHIFSSSVHYFSSSCKCSLSISLISLQIHLSPRTPLHIAAGNGHLESCIFLREKMQLESGGRRDPIGVNAPLDLSGTTPVGWAAVCSK